MKKTPKKGSTTAGRRAQVAPVHLLSTATRQQVSQYTMLQSITTGTFEDVKFYLFSRRKGGSGLAHTPRALYANSALICKASSHFDFVLSAGFAESEVTDMDAPFPSGREDYTLDYDYALDSDLDDEGDDDATTESGWHSATASVSVTPRSSRVHAAVNYSPAGTPGTVGVGRSQSPTGELGEYLVGEDALKPESVAQRASEKDLAVPEEEMKHGVDNTPRAAAPGRGRKGRVVFIEDIAYRTWEAFIFYAYFDLVSFAPLGSQKTYRKSEFFQPPPCSPKSMYRLAEKYGIETLKRLAMEDLATKLTAHNILVELFSPFTMTYSGILDVELKWLRQNITREEVLQDLPKLLQALEDGTLPRGSTGILSRILTGAASQGKRGW